MCAALSALRKQAGPSSTVFTALKHGSASRCALSSPTATIAFYANGSLGRDAQNNAPAIRAKLRRGILGRGRESFVNASSMLVRRSIRQCADTVNEPLVRPAPLKDPRPIPERDFGVRPLSDRRQVGLHRNQEIADTGDLFDQVLPTGLIVPAGRCATANGSSMPRSPSPVPSKSWPISPATPTVSRSPTAVCSISTKAMSASAGRTIARTAGAARSCASTWASSCAASCSTSSRPASIASATTVCSPTASAPKTSTAAGGRSMCRRRKPTPAAMTTARPPPTTNRRHAPAAAVA